MNSLMRIMKMFKTFYFFLLIQFIFLYSGYLMFLFNLIAKQQQRVNEQLESVKFGYQANNNV